MRDGTCLAPVAMSHHVKELDNAGLVNVERAGRSLERKAGHNLQNSRWIHSAYRTKAKQVRQLSLRVVRQISRRWIAQAGEIDRIFEPIKLSVIEYVKGVHPQIKVEPFFNGNSLIERHVPVALARAYDYVARRIEPDTAY
jgi:hypothetical protein